jgi:hypothetical protein
MDTQTKREIWLLSLGTIVVEVPVAFAVFAVFSHQRRAGGQRPPRRADQAHLAPRRVIKDMNQPIE